MDPEQQLWSLRGILLLRVSLQYPHRENKKLMIARVIQMLKWKIAEHKRAELGKMKRLI